MESERIKAETSKREINFLFRQIRYDTIYLVLQCDIIDHTKGAHNRPNSINVHEMLHLQMHFRYKIGTKQNACSFEQHTPLTQITIDGPDIHVETLHYIVVYEISELMDKRKHTYHGCCSLFFALSKGRRLSFFSLSLQKQIYIQMFGWSLLITLSRNARACSFVLITVH